MQTIHALHIFVSGFVQGVGFRHATEAKAKQLGIAGWVRNRHDGRVEIWAEAQDVHLDQLTIWLQQGPLTATVDHVTVERAEPINLHAFKILESI